MRSYVKAVTAISAMLLTLVLGASTASAAPAVMTMGPLSSVSYTSAHVTGTVELPSGGFTYYWFEYSADGVNWTPVHQLERSVSSAGSFEVSDDLTGLNGGTEYFVRLAGWTRELSDPEVFSPEPSPSFTTLPVEKPTVLAADDATDVSYTSAKASGSVDRPANPDPAFDASCRFEFVSDDQFNVSGFAGAGAAGCDVNPVTTTGPTAVKADLSGLAAGTTYHLRLTASNAGGQNSLEAASTFTTPAVALPNASIDPVTGLAGTTAHFSGKVTPSSGADPAFEVNWHFECTPECPGLQGGQFSGDGTEHAVFADASGLEPNTSYEVKLVASNAAGQVTAGPQSFKTNALAPVIQQLGPGSIGPDSATLVANINPKNSTVSYQFEWGVDESYGNLTPATPASLGAVDNALHRVTVPLVGLSSSTTYHFRLVATNTETSAVTKGSDRTFTTQAILPPLNGLPDGRVWEKVSPSDKLGSDVTEGPKVNELREMFQAASSGDAIAYGGAGNVGGDGGPAYVQYIARRTASGWQSEGINPRQDPSFGKANYNYYSWLSDDLSKGIVLTHAALNQGDPTQIHNLYLRDIGANSYRTLSNGDALSPATLFYKDWAATQDGSHVVFSEYDSAKSGASPTLFERTPAGVREVGILPDGTPVEAGAGGETQNSALLFPGYNVMSEDGSRIFFSTTSDPATTSEPGMSGALTLLVRIDGSGTIRLSESERSVPSGFRPAKFQSASKDGKTAFFTSYGKLTDGATAGGPADDTGSSDLYRWTETPDGDGHHLTDLTTADSSGGGVLGVVGGSDDGSILYFAATGALTDEAVAGAPNLYLWRKGEGVTLVVTLSSKTNSGSYSDASNWDKQLLGAYGAGAGAPPRFGGARVTPDGRHLAFSSVEPLTSYDTNDTNQLYVYDSDSERIQCASCSSFEPKSKGYSWLLSSTYEAHADVPGKLPNNLSDDGSRLFFDSQDALVPTDSNGVTDVYEWSNGRVHLISSGTSDSPSRFMDASPEGDDVFFTTSQQLVASDVDNLIDLYDARVGGQREPAIQSPCVGDECQGTPAPPPPFPTPSSSSFSALGSQAACEKGKVRKAGRCRKAKKKSRCAKASKSKASKSNARRCTSQRTTGNRQGRGNR